MRNLHHYFYCYVRGLIFGWLQAGKLVSSPKAKLKNAIKSGNLAICFQGFIPPGSPQCLTPCAEIAALAATFDLMSDDLSFGTDSEIDFRSLCRATLQGSALSVLERLAIVKRDKKLKFSGLERGVFAVEIIFAHLGVREYWGKRLDIQLLGIYTQIADDILDAESDFLSDHLNFLKTLNSDAYLKAYLNWWDNNELRWSGYPLVLGWVLRIARKRALRMRKMTAKSRTIQMNTSARRIHSEGINLIVPPSQ
jgi:hypothetical protein